MLFPQHNTQCFFPSLCTECSLCCSNDSHVTQNNSNYFLRDLDSALISRGLGPCFDDCCSPNLAYDALIITYLWTFVCYWCGLHQLYEQEEYELRVQKQQPWDVFGNIKTLANHKSLRYCVYDYPDRRLVVFLDIYQQQCFKISERPPPLLHLHNSLFTRILQYVSPY